MAIANPQEAIRYKKFSEWIKPPNQSVNVQQVLVDLVAIKPNGEDVSLQFVATKALTERDQRQKNFAAVDQAKTEQAEISLGITIDEYFGDGHFGKNKTSYQSYDFRYGPSEFSEEDSRSEHGFFFRYIIYPLLENWRVFTWNRRYGKGAAYEKSGKFWFPYTRLEVIDYGV